ncbi:hypothetical protein ACJO2E_03360 [Marinobacter sp. M1N3S26]|uniref:hypothetical protein n=1 Tax=Marinobacter sp. M1N3S26 TaxID=3382299 RepID=UPI00387AEA95
MDRKHQVIIGAQAFGERQINGYVPDNQFRSRAPKFAHQKDKSGKRQQSLPDNGWKETIPASDFPFEPVNLTCVYPSGETLTYRGQREAENGKIRVHFKGRFLQCRHSLKKHQCIQNSRISQSPEWLWPPGLILFRKHTSRAIPTG